MINDASIYSSIVILVPFLPQLLYLLIKGKRSLPESLFAGRYLFLFLTMIISYLGLIVVALFFSNDYGVLARLIGWLVLSHTGIGLILVSWIIFIMYGYEPRFMFKKVVVPAHMNVLIVIIFWLTILFSLNWWAFIPGTIFTVTSLLWSFKAYKLTKPKYDENLPTRENDEY